MKSLTLLLALLCGMTGCAKPKPEPDMTIWLTQDDSGRARTEGFIERPAPKDHPPLQILVDGEIYHVHYTRRTKMLQAGCTAQVVIHDREIWLSDDENGREARQLVLHELMHVALHDANGEYAHPIFADVGDGEPVINPTARILLDVLRDNPKLMKWLEAK